MASPALLRPEPRSGPPPLMLVDKPAALVPIEVVPEHLGVLLVETCVNTGVPIELRNVNYIRTFEGVPRAVETFSCITLERREDLYVARMKGMVLPVPSQEPYHLVRLTVPDHRNLRSLLVLSSAPADLEMGREGLVRFLPEFLTLRRGFGGKKLVIKPQSGYGDQCQAYDRLPRGEKYDLEFRGH